MAAVAVLSSFPSDDTIWHALAAALIERDGRVPVLAGQILSSFARWHPRTVSWAPAAADLHAALDGATLIMLPDLLDVLATTNVDPSLAAPLLRGGGHGVLMYAGARHRWARGAAQRFLRTISGRYEVSDPGEWEAWVAGL
jgi:hypothetical protein